jgi:GntR family transcriptional regulator
MSPAAADQPRYLQIAEELGRRIDAGTLSVGVPLPSDAELQAEFGVARNTVRQAMDALRTQGRIHTIKGRGSFIRPQVPTRRIASTRYRADMDSTPDNPQSSVTADHGITWDQHNPDAVITEEPATPELADLFGVAEDTMLLRRDLVFRVGGYPTHMSTSYYLLEMVAGTWVAGPGSEPAAGGAIGHLKSLGITVTKIRERVVSRLPTDHEARTLRMSGGPVLALTRQMFTGARVVEVAREIVIPGENVELEYEIDL